MDQKP